MEAPGGKAQDAVKRRYSACRTNLVTEEHVPERKEKRRIEKGELPVLIFPSPL